MSIYLINNNQSSLDERVIRIEKSSPCVTAPKSEECATQLNTFVHLLSPEQSIVIICKSVRHLDVSCYRIKQAIKLTSR